VNSGYPPVRGFHCHRALLNLQDVLRTTVISIRALTHQRIIPHRYVIDGIDVYEIYVPVVPYFNKNIYLVTLAAYYSYPFVKNKIKEAIIIEAGSLLIIISSVEK